MTYLRSIDTVISANEPFNFSAVQNADTFLEKNTKPVTAWNSGDIPLLRHFSIPARFNLLIFLAFIICAIVGVVYGLGEWRINQAVSAHAQFQRQADLDAQLRVLGLGMETDTSRLIGASEEGAIGDFSQRAKEAEAILAISDSKALRDGFTKASEGFAKLAQATLMLGLTEEAGLRGKLKNSVVAIEGELKLWPGMDDLWSKMLRMRQTEKDFMLFHDPDHLGRHKKFAREFEFAIDASTLGEGERNDFQALLSEYVKNMEIYGEKFIEQQQAINETWKAFRELQPIIAASAAKAKTGADAASQSQQQTRGQVLTATITVGAVGFIIFIMVCALSARSIVRPVVAMEKAMNRLAEGDISVKAPGLGRRDEIGEMAKAMQVFIDNARAMATLRSEQSEQQAIRERRAMAMEEMIRHFDSQVGEIVEGVSRSVDDLGKVAVGVRRFADDTATRLEDVDVNSGTVNQRVQAMAAVTEELARSIEEISLNACRSADISAANMTSAKRGDQLIIELLRAVGQIDIVVQMIQGIAGQTNLLALNAAIEATRAGEHGAGFAVVAGEVRELAGKTAQATSEISGQISAVQSASHGVAEAVREILKALAETGETAAAISGAVEEQRAATHEIARMAQDAANGTAGASESISAIAADADGIRSSTRTLAMASANTSTATTKLERAVSDFLGEIRAL
jgi:methyl-accepting chemotaxis protein